MSATEQFVASLGRLKSGETSLLRAQSGMSLNESVEGFDLFSGIWWPLRQKNQRAPRREVAWLVAKLHASYPMPHSPDNTLALRMGRCQPAVEAQRLSFARRFDHMLQLPLGALETPLRLALGRVSSERERGLDWVRLTDDLSIWERKTTRLKWAQQFMRIQKEEEHADRDSHDSEPQPREP